MIRYYSQEWDEQQYPLYLPNNTTKERNSNKMIYYYRVELDNGPQMFIKTELAPPLDKAVAAQILFMPANKAQMIPHIKQITELTEAKAAKVCDINALSNRIEFEYGVQYVSDIEAMVYMGTPSYYELLFDEDVSFCIKAGQHVLPNQDVALRILFHNDPTGQKQWEDHPLTIKEISEAEALQFYDVEDLTIPFLDESGIYYVRKPKPV